MFISKINNKDYLFFNNNGKRVKLSFQTLEKIVIEYYNTSSKSSNVFTLSKLEKEVLNYAKVNLSKSSQEIYRKTCSNLIGLLGDMPLEQITTKDIETFKEMRCKTVRKTSVNVEVRTLKAIFNLAVRWKWVLESPMKEVKQFTIPQKEPITFTDAEIQLLHSTLSETIKPIVEVALLTGCRINEILNLQFKDIDLVTKVIKIRNKEGFKTKNGRNREIPISDKLEGLLNRLTVNTSSNNIISFNSQDAYLFTKGGFKFSAEYVSKAFKKSLRLAGLPEKFHFHCLRHTFVTNLVKSGVNVSYVKQLAGHQDIKTTENYIHLLTEDLREAVNKI